MLLLSNSVNGLPNAINGINEYSTKWGLRINTDKTKVMIFQSPGRLRKQNFLLDDKALEVAKEFNYPGITFSNTGSLKQSVKVLSQKSMKAMFGLLKSVQNMGFLDPLLTCRLYETLRK